MPVKINVSGVWKDVPTPKINVSGAWKTVNQVWVNVSGTWKTCIAQGLDGVEYYSLAVPEYFWTAFTDIETPSNNYQMVYFDSVFVSSTTDMNATTISYGGKTYTKLAYQTTIDNGNNTSNDYYKVKRT